MNGSNGIVSGSLCFAPLDDRVQDAPNKIEITAIAESHAYAYSSDPIDRALDRYCIEGGPISAAALTELPDDRGEFIDVVCRVRAI